MFEQATEGIVGAGYDPIAIAATQVVDGTNYCFLAEETVATPDSNTDYVLVYIHENAEGNAEVTDVVDYI